MQNDRICSEIVGSLARTKSEANVLMDEIEILEQSLYKIGEADFNSTLQKSIRAKTANAVMQAIGGGSKEVILRTLKEKINNLDYLVLKLAFEPTLEIISKLYGYINANIGSGIAMDITIDKRIIGGAIIEFRGKIMDLSVAGELKDYYLNLEK